MSISTEISRLQQAKSDLATSITNKGVTVPAATTIDGYAALVDQIQQGGLPYDSKIEYLRATGTQYINTGIVPNLNTQVNLKCKFNTYIQSGMVCGARLGTSTPGRFFPCASSGTDKCRFTIGTKEFSMNLNYGSTVYEIFFNDPSHRVIVNNSVLGTFSSTGFTITENNPICLFGTSGYGDEHYLSDSSIYELTIMSKTNIIMNLIPVRVGQVGYMYDRVSGRLFGNAGTGSFTLGPDVV